MSPPCGSNVLNVSSSQLHLGHDGDGSRWRQQLLSVFVHPAGCCVKRAADPRSRGANPAPLCLCPR